MQEQQRLHPLFELLLRLDLGGHRYFLSRRRSDAVLVTVTFHDERAEIDVFEDGRMQVSRFLGREDVPCGEDIVWQLLHRNEEAL